jgi:DNA-binding MarR family transcriptional regulator
MPTKLPVDPGTISATCLCLGLRRAARTVSRRLDEALAPLELNNGQFSMLAAVAGLQPVGIQALAEHLAMDRTTVTASLKPLQRRGLVAVEVCKSDSRVREAELTSRGNALLAKAIPVWQVFQQALAGAVSPRDAVRLRGYLAALG